MRRSGSRKSRRRVRGGKALARLVMFQAQRGLGIEAMQVRSTKRGTPAKAPHAAAAPTVVQQYAAARAAALASPPAPGAQPWRFLGPSLIPHGQTYGKGPKSRPPVSGRVSAIAVDPKDAKHILCGSAGGGIWESKDRGKTWMPRTDGQASLAIGALVFDRTDPKRVYAGTGEGNSYSQLGAGVLRSMDGGTTWSLATSPDLAGHGFFALRINPANPKHLIGATTNGLVRSTDRGVTWALVRPGLAWDVSFAPGDVEILAATISGLVRSVDGGATWTQKSLVGATAKLARMAVVHAPTGGGVVYVFAAYQVAGASKPTAMFWRRGSATGTLQTVAVPAAFDAGQAWYDWVLAVSPSSSDVVYIGGIDLYRGVRSPTKFTWADLSSRPSPGDSIHPDQHVLAFAATEPASLYAGSDGGIFFSPDEGTSWQSLNPGLGITEFEYLTDHPTQVDWLLGGTQDNGTLRRSVTGTTWDHVADGDGGDCDSNRSQPATCYHTFYEVSLERSDTGGASGSWIDVTPPVPTTYQSLFYPPLVVNGALVAMAGESLLLSKNSGGSWSSVALTNIHYLASAAWALSGGAVLVGSGGGEIWIVRPKGGGFTVEARPSPVSGYLSDIAAVDTNENEIWVTCSTVGRGHVFRSVDGGNHWINATANLPDLPVNALVLDPAHAGTVYLATDAGVWVTRDAAATWRRLGTGLPNAIVGDLALHATARRLRAGTRCRGVWEIDAP